MATTKDDDIMLHALRKERDEAHQKVMQLDRLIKKILSGNYSPKSVEINNDNGVTIGIPTLEPQLPFTLNSFPKNADIKVQVLKVFDSLKVASKLKELQTEYNRLSESHYNIREIVRSLHKSRLLRLMKEIDANRGIFWVKAEWLEDDRLKEEFKPVGFDMIYKQDNLEYE